MSRLEPMHRRTCWLCGRNGSSDPLDRHHIFGGSNRRLSEELGLWVPLCHHRCHDGGPNSVHRNAETAQRLHEYGQLKAMRAMGWTAEEFRLNFGKNYLPEEQEAAGEEEDGFEIDE